MVEERWQEWKGEDRTDAPFPCWDEVTLTLGRAIGKGEWTVKVEPLDKADEQEVAAWLASLRHHRFQRTAHRWQALSQKQACQELEATLRLSVALGKALSLWGDRDGLTTGAYRLPSRRPRAGRLTPAVRRHSLWVWRMSPGTSWWLARGRRG